MRKIIGIGVVAFLLTTTLLWAGGARESSDGLEIVASTGHIGDAVARIAPDANLRVLMGPGSDPHTYTPTTREAQALERADIVFWNGLELEIQMVGVFQGLGDRAFEVGRAVPEHMLLAWEGHHDHDHGHDDHGHDDHGHDDHGHDDHGHDDHGHDDHGHDDHGHDDHGHDDHDAHDDHGHGHDDHGLSDVLSHACKHIDDEPVNVRALSGSSLTEISGTHTRFEIALLPGDADRGRLIYETSRSSDYLFLLDRDMRLEVFDRNGNKIADESHGHGPADGCPSGIKYYVFELGHDDYTLAFSRGAGSDVVNLVVERMGHGHDDHGHAHDDHGHDHGHDHDHDHGEHDPHLWWDLDIWVRAVQAIADRISEQDPNNAERYQSNAADYIAELRDLQAYATARFREVPASQRFLVTSHDAFGYLARAYGFQSRGITGISTEDEAGVRDLQELAQFIVDNDVRAVFFETIEDRRSVVALEEAVASRGGRVVVSDTQLYSDALGERAPTNTFDGAYRHNVDAIVDTILGNR